MSRIAGTVHAGRTTAPSPEVGARPAVGPAAQELLGAGPDPRPGRAWCRPPQVLAYLPSGPPQPEPHDVNCRSHTHPGAAPLKNLCVKWFNAEKDFGFVAQDGGGPDVFAHYSAINSSGFRELQEGQMATFDVAQGLKGRQVAYTNLGRPSRPRTERATAPGAGQAPAADPAPGVGPPGGRWPDPGQHMSRAATGAGRSAAPPGRSHRSQP